MGGKNAPGWGDLLTCVAFMTPYCVSCYVTIQVPFLEGSVVEHRRAPCGGLKAGPSGTQRSEVVAQGSLWGGA